MNTWTKQTKLALPILSSYVLQHQKQTQRNELALQYLLWNSTKCPKNVPKKFKGVNENTINCESAFWWFGAEGVRAYWRAILMQRGSDEAVDLEQPYLAEGALYGLVLETKHKSSPSNGAVEIAKSRLKHIHEWNRSSLYRRLKNTS